MIIQFHTPKGTFTVDTDTVTDKELAELDGMNRQKLNKTLADQPRDLPAEIDELKARLDKITKVKEQFNGN